MGSRIPIAVKSEVTGVATSCAVFNYFDQCILGEGLVKGIYTTEAGRCGDPFKDSSNGLPWS